MELLSTQFLTALMAIIVIDLVLAGDNAIVIALAARNLPQHLRKRAMIWGAGGAVLVRSSMTVLVVWLLQIPGLLLVGGLLLVWIAYKLLLPEDGNGDGTGINGAGTFWGAIRTIVIADTVMGLDNVLGVAGAAHGSFLLVVLGLLISIPILIWGSGMLLRFIERFPGFVYLGAGVLALTAAKMIASEPYLKDPLAAYAFTVPLLYFVTVFGVLWIGFVKNHVRLEFKISAKLASPERKLAARPPISTLLAKNRAIVKVLVPIDGSRNSQHAVGHVVKEFTQNTSMEIHLLNVQPLFSKYIARFVGRKNLETFHRDEAEKALQSVKHMLDDLGVSYTIHIKVGNKAAVIAEMAAQLGCDQIVMGTARKNSLTRMLEDSVTNRVLELTSVPVEVIAGDAVSRTERYGIPVGLAAALALLFLSGAN